jgi:chemotaxis methyl-accepting protein methylase
MPPLVYYITDTLSAARALSISNHFLLASEVAIGRLIRAMSEKEPGTIWQMATSIGQEVISCPQTEK